MAGEVELSEEQEAESSEWRDTRKEARAAAQKAAAQAKKEADRKAKKEARKIVSSGKDIRIAKLVKNDPSLFGTVTKVKFALDDDIDSFLRGYINRDTPESERRISDNVIAYVDKLSEENKRIWENVFDGN